VRQIAYVLFVVLQLWVVCAIGRAVLSWFPLGYDSGWSKLNHLLVRITEPLIAPVRRLLGPVRVGGIGIDLAFLIVVLVIEVIAIPVLRAHS
jgi:YggT family protein